MPVFRPGPWKKAVQWLLSRLGGTSFDGTLYRKKHQILPGANFQVVSIKPGIGGGHQLHQWPCARMWLSQWADIVDSDQHKPDSSTPIADGQRPRSGKWLKTRARAWLVHWAWLNFHWLVSAWNRSFTRSFYLICILCSWVSGWCLPWRWKDPLRDYLGHGNGSIPHSSIWMRRPSAYINTCQVTGQFSAQSTTSPWRPLSGWSWPAKVSIADLKSFLTSEEDGTVDSRYNDTRLVRNQVWAFASNDLKDAEPSGLGSNTIISDQHFFNLLGEIFAGDKEKDVLAVLKRSAVFIFAENYFQCMRPQKM